MRDRRQMGMRPTARLFGVAGQASATALAACVLFASAQVIAHAANPAPVPTSATPALAPATTPETATASAKPADMTMSGFLDRLMAAESGGRDTARNPRSTAVGPFQFIESTWLDLVRREFASETKEMTSSQILALRTDRGFARRAAEIYTKENAAILKSHGLDATFPRLRLAFLLGPNGAVRVLQAQPQTRVTLLLGPAVAQANPFMFGLTAESLIARSARDLAVSVSTLAGLAAGDIPAGAAGAPGKPRAPRVVVRCNLDLPACRRWQALATARLPASRPGRKQLAADKAR
jgi:hypothetical protein